MADMVPHEIEPAKGAGGAAHDATGERVVAQIADQCQRPPAGRADFAGDGFDPGPIDVDNPDRRPLAGKAQGARPTHPRSRRGDDADLAFEPHGSLR